MVAIDEWIREIRQPAVRAAVVPRTYRRMDRAKLQIESARPNRQRFRDCLEQRKRQGRIAPNADLDAAADRLLAGGVLTSNVNDEERPIGAVGFVVIVGRSSASAPHAPRRALAIDLGGFCDCSWRRSRPESSMANC
jgi:hypothetical protein